MYSTVEPHNVQSRPKLIYKWKTILEKRQSCHLRPSRQLRVVDRLHHEKVLKQRHTVYSLSVSKNIKCFPKKSSGRLLTMLPKEPVPYQILTIDRDPCQNELFLRPYSEMQSSWSMICNFIKDDIFVTIFTSPGIKWSQWTYLQSYWLMIGGAS